MSFCYNKVSERFWTDEKVTDWADSTKLLALYLLTCPHRTSEGLFRLPQKYIMADLAWDAQTFDRAFSRLSRDGFLEYDPKAQVILLPNALKYCEFRNENQVKGAVNKLRELPKTDLLFRFLEVCESSDSPYLKQIGLCFETEWDLFRNKTEFVSNTLTQTQSLTQDQTQTQDIPPSPQGESARSKSNTKQPKKDLSPEGDPYFIRIFNVWNKIKSGQAKVPTFKNWMTLVRLGKSREDLRRAGMKYLAAKRAEQTEPQYIKAISNFYGRDGYYSDWMPQNGEAVKEIRAPGEEWEEVYTCLDGLKSDPLRCRDCQEEDGKEYWITDYWVHEKWMDSKVHFVDGIKREKEREAACQALTQS